MQRPPRPLLQVLHLHPQPQLLLGVRELRRLPPLLLLLLRLLLRSASTPRVLGAVVP